MTKLRTNSKIVRQQVGEHILDMMTLDELKSNLAVFEYLHDADDYRKAWELIDGGCFLCYHHDVQDFLNGLGINPEGKEYSNDKSWDLYRHLLSSEIEKMVKA